jgi:hypothetical protein
MRLIIDLDDDNRVTALGDGKPAIICESVKRMASQICTVAEIYNSGEEYVSVMFADVTYLSDDEAV